MLLAARPDYQTGDYGWPNLSKGQRIGFAYRPAAHPVSAGSVVHYRQLAARGSGSTATIRTAHGTFAASSSPTTLPMGAESRVGAADGGGDALRSRVPWLLRYGCFRRLVGSNVLDAEALSGPRPRAPKGVKPTIPMASTVAAAGLRLARIAAGLHEEQKSCGHCSAHDRGLVLRSRERDPAPC